MTRNTFSLIVLGICALFFIPAHAWDGIAAGAGGLFLVALFAGIYFFPTILAGSRRHMEVLPSFW